MPLPRFKYAKVDKVFENKFLNYFEGLPYKQRERILEDLESSHDAPLDE